MKNWLKVLGVSLIMYSLLAGMLVPLSSGITRTTPSTAVLDTAITIDIYGYNTHFAQTKNQIFLKTDNDYVLPALSHQVRDDLHISALFAIPSSIPGEPGTQGLTVFVNNELDGSAIYPSALFVSSSLNSTDGWKPLNSLQLTGRQGVFFPYRNILMESIRNIYYHVVLWFAMFLILGLSVFNSIQYIRKNDVIYDDRARAYAEVGVLFGILGTLTGMVWANYTWGSPWSLDVKQNMTAIFLLIYLAYFIFRSSIDDLDKRYRVAAAYNIFAFATIIPLLFIIPRLQDSLHPGSGGNPALGSDDLDNHMRMVFYPAIIGWMIFGLWLANIARRFHTLERKRIDSMS